MKYLEKIKKALEPLRHIPGVEGCWLEAEEGDIVHVYTMTRTVDYDLDQRIFDKYEEVEECFPEVSFELLTTFRSPSPQAEVVFLSSDESASSTAAVAV